MPTELRHGIYFYWHDTKFKMVYEGRNIEFDEVISVFDDPLMVANIDTRFDYEELRMVSVGMSNQGKLLAVAWYESDEDSITIITAFKPSTNQTKGYNNV